MAELDAHSKLIIEIRTLMKDRDVARNGSDFGKSDAIRERLSALGVVIKDQKVGPSGWKFADGRSNKLPSGVKQSQIPVTAQKIRTIAPEAGGKRGREEGSGKDNAAKKSKIDGKPGKEEKIKGGPPDKGKALPEPKKEAPRPQSAEEQRNKSALSGIVGSGGKGKNVNGVLIEVLKEGSGTRKAENGQRVKMGYVGKLTNGRVFDASGQKPFVFKLGRSEVIKGWDIGVLGMKIGEKRKLTIPPEKGYGKSGSPPTIPGNATLVFDVTLIDIM